MYPPPEPMLRGPFEGFRLQTLMAQARGMGLGVQFPQIHPACRCTLAFLAYGHSFKAAQH
jgi:hypothetical protein